MTAIQTGTGKNKILTNVNCLELILKTMGHQVTKKTIRVNEDLSEYDKVITFLFPFEKLGSTRKYSILSAMWNHPDKIIISFDDWQYYQFQDSLASCIRAGRLFNWVDKYPDFSSKEDREQILASDYTRKSIEEVARKICNDYTFPVLLPMFKFNHRENRYVKTSNWVGEYDPSLFAIDYVNTNYIDIEFPPEKKERNWVMASLFNQEEYLQANGIGKGWPVLQYGHRKTMPVLTEPELCNVYQKNWGILSPRYPIAGCWRARWIFAYMFDCIIFADKSECPGLPTGFVETISQIENRNDEELERFQKNQQLALSLQFESKESVIATFQSILEI